MHAVTQMNPLQATRTEWNAVRSSPTSSQSIDTVISDRLAFNKADPSQFGQGCKMDDRGIREPMTARQIDISDPITGFDEVDDGGVRDERAMAEMDVMKVLAKLGDRLYPSIRDLLAFGQHQVAQTRSAAHNLGHGSVG